MALGAAVSVASPNICRDNDVPPINKIMCNLPGIADSCGPLYWVLSIFHEAISLHLFPNSNNNNDDDDDNDDDMMMMTHKFYSHGLGDAT